MGEISGWAALVPYAAVLWLRPRQTARANGNGPVRMHHGADQRATPRHRQRHRTGNHSDARDPLMPARIVCGFPCNGLLTENLQH